MEVYQRRTCTLLAVTYNMCFVISLYKLFLVWLEVNVSRLHVSGLFKGLGIDQQSSHLNMTLFAETTT